MSTSTLSENHTNVADTDPNSVSTESVTDVEEMNEDSGGEMETKQVDVQKPDIPGAEDVSEEEPMPTPEECFKRHLSKKVYNMLHERSEEEINRLHTIHSPHDLATQVESAHRAMKPHEQNVKMMQKIAQQFGKSKKDQANWEKTYSTFMNKYTESLNMYNTVANELKTTVLNYVYDLIDNEQQVRVDMYKKCKPLSKGKRKHFFDALSDDDDVKCMKTLGTVHDVQAACYSIQHTIHKNNPKLALLCAFVQDHRSLPTEGSHKCLNALLSKYTDFFEETDIQAVLNYIHVGGFDIQKGKSITVLKQYC